MIYKLVFKINYYYVKLLGLVMIKKVDRKQIIIIWLGVLLLSGCRSMQDQSANSDANVRVSGDVTVSAIGRSGGIYEK